MSILALLLVVLLGACSLAHGTEVVLYHTNTRDERGWVHIKLDVRNHIGRTPIISEIDWCSAVSPTTPSDGPHVNRATGTCTGANVMHKKLYAPARPGATRLPRDVIRVNLVRMSIYVNPTLFGGLDPTREAYIMVRTTFGDDSTLINVLRMDVPQLVPDHVSLGPVLPLPAMPAKDPGTTTTPYKLPWYLLMIGWMGCLLCVGLVAGVLFINKHPGGWTSWSKSVERLGQPQRVYGTSQYPFSNGRTAQITDVKREETTRNLETFISLGMGANEAFRQNL